MADLLKYIVYWQNLIIGKIYENNNNFKYYPNYDNIEEATNSGLPKALVITPQLEWGKMPSFFDNRMKTDVDCQNLCCSSSDKLTIKKIR